MVLDDANARFWEELCGTGLVRSLGIVELDQDSLARYDAAYFAYYPYLAPLVERAGLAGRRVLEIGLRARPAVRGRDVRYGDRHRCPAPHRRSRAGYRRSLAGPATRWKCARHGLQRPLIPAARIPRPSQARRRGASASRSTKSDLRAMYEMYDRRADGGVAPHTDFETPGEMRRLFRRFSSVSLERRNFDDYVVAGRLLRRRWFLRGIDRLLGLDLYITVVK